MTLEFYNLKIIFPSGILPEKFILIMLIMFILNEAQP